MTGDANFFSCWMKEFLKYFAWIYIKFSNPHFLGFTEVTSQVISPQKFGVSIACLMVVELIRNEMRVWPADSERETMLIALSSLLYHSGTSNRRTELIFVEFPFVHQVHLRFLIKKMLLRANGFKGGADDSPLRGRPTQICAAEHIGWQAFVCLTTHWKAHSKQILRKLFGCEMSSAFLFDISASTVRHDTWNVSVLKLDFFLIAWTVVWLLYGFESVYSTRSKSLHSIFATFLHPQTRSMRLLNKIWIREQFLMKTMKPNRPETETLSWTSCSGDKSTSKLPPRRHFEKTLAESEIYNLRWKFWFRRKTVRPTWKIIFKSLQTIQVQGRAWIKISSCRRISSSLRFAPTRLLLCDFHFSRLI